VAFLSEVLTARRRLESAQRRAVSLGGVKLRSIAATSARSDKGEEAHTATRLLILGLRPALVVDFRLELGRIEDVELVTGSDLDGLGAAFALEDVDHVLLGGGLDVATRPEGVREVFRLSDRATVHMKDQLSGPEGFVPFARAVLRGLADYERSRRRTRSCERSDPTELEARPMRLGHDWGTTSRRLTTPPLRNPCNGEGLR
jgi:hypothetical protein